MFRILFLILFLISGCATSGGPGSENLVDVSKAMPLVDFEERPATGSIFADQQSSKRFGFLKSFSVGDIVTVILNESTQAQRSGGINLTKEVKNNPLSQLTAVFGNNLGNGPDPMWNDGRRIKRALKGIDHLNQVRSDKGTGVADQAASLNGAIAVIVTRVFPNGNMFIEGKKQLALSEGQEEIFISGVITPKDVQPDNTVLSSRIAQASIAYRGKGDVTNVATANWGSRIFNRLWPF